MRRMNTLAAVALALMLGLAAPCVRAQHHGGGGGGGGGSHAAPAPHGSAPHSAPQNHGGGSGHPPAGTNHSYPAGSLHQQARGAQPPAGYRPQGVAPNNAYRPQ